MRKLTQAEFLERSRLKHGNQYDYSLTDFNGLKEFVTIICKEHGEFQQRAGEHFRYGCNQCGIERTREAKRLDTETVIKRSQETHGERYDYSLTKYVDSETKILIGCKIHGFFEQLPGVHYKGSGCNECGNESMKLKQLETKDEFIKKARQIHGDALDYSNVDYRGSHVKVEIICPIHGPFYQTPASHKSGNYCRHCSFEMNAKGTRIGIEEFISRARKIHEDKYDYSKSKYKSKDTPLIILCPTHGQFDQSPANHIRGGQGCPTCGREKMAESNRLTKGEFLSVAKKVHGEDYDYSKIVYIDTKTPVQITHRKCGRTFFQVPQQHKQGSGCEPCARELAGMNRRISFSEFVVRSTEVHGDAYVYFEDEYQTTQIKTKIVHLSCETSFLQTPTRHMTGRGCPKCNHGGYDPTNNSAIYYVLSLSNNLGDVVYYKGGITSDLQRRMDEHRRKMPQKFSISLIQYIDFDDGYELIEFEKILLNAEEIRAPLREFPGGNELFLTNPITFANEHGLLD